MMRARENMITLIARRSVPWEQVTIAATWRRESRSSSKAASGPADVIHEAAASSRTAPSTIPPQLRTGSCCVLTKDHLDSGGCQDSCRLKGLHAACCSGVDSEVGFSHTSPTCGPSFGSPPTIVLDCALEPPDKHGDAFPGSLDPHHDDAALA